MPASSSPDTASDAIDAFAARWRGAQAAEIANAQTFIIELCELLGVSRPDPATKDPARDAYVFERPVAFQDGASASGGRIDLYKRGCFVLETKQGVDADNAARGAGKARSAGHGTRGTTAWERTMAAAKRQAERYARNLDLPAANGIAAHAEPVPPLVIACDVGHCLDLYANFGHPQRYVPFPDGPTYRITLDRLHDPDVRERLRLAFTDPEALDPSRRQARVTRELAATLARLAASLEAAGHGADAVFGFLSRSLFTMFAEDARLVPERSFSRLLADYSDAIDVLPDALSDLWATMDTGGFSAALKARLRRFNGGLFSDTTALPLDADQHALLVQAASADWREVEPAIFGTLLERALDARERHKLGAHYTPRAYVERLVIPAVVDPLREEWEATQAAVAQIETDADMRAEARRDAVGRETDAEATSRRRVTQKAVLDELRRFMTRLTSVRVLDPACGSGNFLYVTLEHLKRIEGEVQAAMARYGASALDLEGVAVTPAQFLGIEVNPGAAAIADLVLWIGYLQWHLRTHGGPQGLADPVLRAYGNIEHRDAVLAYDAATPRVNADGEPVTTWDGRTTTPHPVTGEEVPDASARVTVLDYENARPAMWPEADFIVGNPPFVGNKRMRDVLGDGYTEALRRAYPDVPDSADFVMYWWHKAAEFVRSGATERFGLITTNSITMVFNRQTVEAALGAVSPLSLGFAVPDHPWVDSAGGAAVRVAMTVGVAGEGNGVLTHVVSERADADHEAREVVVTETIGRINSDLTVGADLTAATPLKANAGLAFMGLIPLGTGFRLDVNALEEMGYDPTELPRTVRRYKTGGDVARSEPDRLLIDFHGLTQGEARDAQPRLYQHLLDQVKPFRDDQKRAAYREKWWLHAEARPELRGALRALNRYVATVETSKHRYFVFLDADVLPDQKLRVVAHDDAYVLAVLSSRIHLVWALNVGGTLEDRPVYNGSKIFDPFPFPAATDAQQAAIRTLGERLDAHRARVQTAHAHAGLTLTGLYNALAAARAGRPLVGREAVDYERGQVGILRETHDALDTAVAEAYGWPADLNDQQILTRLVALNAERQAEEAAGLVRHLRPGFQAPGQTTQATLDVSVAEPAVTLAEMEPWPAATAARALALRRVLREAGRPLAAEDVAKRFKRAPRAIVADLLDTLVSLGQARRTDSDTFAA